MQTLQAKSNTIPSLFFIKAICAFLVVIIHTDLPWKEYINPFLRIAVPIFFMISGYFTYTTTRKATEKKIIKYLKKILWITLYANFIYYFVALSISLVNHTEFTINITSIKFWFRFTFYGDNISGILWYLTAYLWTLLTYLFFFKIDRLSYILILSPGLIIINILNQFIFSIDIPSFILTGIPSVSIGYCIHKYLDTIKSYFSPSSASTSLFLCSFVAICEALILHLYQLNGIVIYIMTFPLATSCIIWCLLHPNFAGGGIWETIGRKYSLNIYLFHIIAYLLVNQILKIFTRGNISEFTPYSALYALPASLLLAIILDKIKRRTICIIPNN